MVKKMVFASKDRDEIDTDLTGTYLQMNKKHLSSLPETDGGFNRIRGNSTEALKQVGCTAD